MLPIDPLLPDIVARVREAGNVVLVAPPGAGKTTRVPPALLDAQLAGERDIVVVQPRRLAARMAASRVAHERGEKVGESIGYEVRFDRRVSAATRVRFVTEGVLNRQLAGDALLERVGVVVIDEFHERSLAGDLALALLRRAQLGARRDLCVVVMSATLDPGPVSAYLGGCPVLESEGRAFEVVTDYASGPDDRRLATRVSSAVRSLTKDGPDGDVLVFLPGAAEIRRAMDACADVAERRDLLRLPLHGGLSPEQQDRAVNPARRRKLILSTNVAETSVTIDGITAVVDSGLAKIARHSPWSGIPTLRVEPVSRASAIQRAGRAGRTRPGRCVRLYTRHDFDHRREYDVPEVSRADLSDTALVLHSLGVADLAAFEWFEPPGDAAIAAAAELLRRLGAVDASGRVTEIGARMIRFPLHPRQARILVEAERRGIAREGCTLAALIGERAQRRDRGEAAVSGPSDLLDEMDAARSGGARGLARVAKQLGRLVNHRLGDSPATDEAFDDAVMISTLCGYPDRIARRRRPRSAELVFSGGGSGTLSQDSVVVDAQLVVAVDAEEVTRGGRKQTVVRRASAVDPDWLLDLYTDRISDADEHVWNRDRKRVDRVSRILYGDFAIDEDDAVVDRSRSGPVLATAAAAVGIERFVSADDLAQLRARVAFVSQTFPDSGVMPIDDDAVGRALVAACEGLVSFEELRGANLLAAIRREVGTEQRFVDEVAPSHIALPKRRRVPVHYEADRPPWIESRLQDFFGMTDGPTVGGGRVALVLHLLAPNRRAVQVTSDLAGFWDRHYPSIRKQLMRRYPKHAWPESPV
jgi:ATP-dependent helicase HrpB